MSIATYRGVKYDTTKLNTQFEQRTVQETYRGVKHNETVRSTK